MQNIIVWFRQDLRIKDNPALWNACKEGSVIAVYILDPTHPVGNAQHWWLHHSLHALKNALAQLNIPLVLKQGAAFDEIKKLLHITKARKIFWNRCYEPQVILRDKKIKTYLKEQEIEVHTFNASLLTEPMDILNKQGHYFKVFSAYWKHCSSILHPRLILPEPIPQTAKPHTFKSDDIQYGNRLSNKFDWRTGEKAALAKLHYFLEHSFHRYHVERDYPTKKACSYLSPHLHFGELSPWQVYNEVLNYVNKNPHLEPAFESFLKELGWREFSYYLLYHLPSIIEKNVNPTFNLFHWENNVELLNAWKKGLTGFPIVDAGMRELWHTGYMHNRVRMVVASFLTKDLLIDWREGSAWFLDTLLDADLASNAINWQWVAGCGIDPSPYFRIFNPILQSKKFDPDGIYIKKWVPELKELPKKYIHTPWEAPELLAGKNYPKPIVEHEEARKKALLAYRRIFK